MASFDPHLPTPLRLGWRLVTNLYKNPIDRDRYALACEFFFGTAYIAVYPLRSSRETIRLKRLALLTDERGGASHFAPNALFLRKVQRRLAHLGIPTSLVFLEIVCWPRELYPDFREACESSWQNRRPELKRLHEAADAGTGCMITLGYEISTLHISHSALVSGQVSVDWMLSIGEPNAHFLIENEMHVQEAVDEANRHQYGASPFCGVRVSVLR